MKYALLAALDDDLRIVAIKDYDPDWVADLRDKGNPKAAFIRDIVLAAPPNAPLGQHAVATLERDADAVRQAWTLAPLPVPAVSARQIRLALSRAGLRQAVESVVAAAPIEVRDYWEYSTELHREHPIVAQMGFAMGLSDAQIDALFWQASLL